MRPSRQLRSRQLVRPPHLNYQDSLVRAWLLLRNREDEKAISPLEEAIEAQPDDVRARAVLGDVFRTLGRWSEAARNFEAAIRLRPEHGELHRLLGICYDQLQRPGDAINHYREAIRLDSRDGTAHLLLGMSLYDLYTQDNETATLVAARAALREARACGVGRAQRLLDAISRYHGLPALN